jgi:23S rRNA pseudouridine2605 synthase
MKQTKKVSTAPKKASTDREKVGIKSETKQKKTNAFSIERKVNTRDGEKSKLNSKTPRSPERSALPKSDVLSGQAPDEKMPLNKFIAHCGICSRRDAVELIKKGLVKVNGLVQTEPGTKVSETDLIVYEEKQIHRQTELVYYLLNKPKDFITTTDDPEGRKTVFNLLPPDSAHRIFPVGRLDRNTTGLLLLTNDGDLAQKLAHPKNKIKKVYQVVLDKALTKKDFERIALGVTLEDGAAYVDQIAYTDPKSKNEIGLEIHIGRNRIVRRIFEHLGYQVKHLDRVMYAGLTKKNLQRGKWRALTPQEIIFLKHFR